MNAYCIRLSGMEKALELIAGGALASKNHFVSAAKAKVHWQSTSGLKSAPSDSSAIHFLHLRKSATDGERPQAQ